ncbi:MAG: TRAP transporter large permease [Chloroflexota bacterium]
MEGFLLLGIVGLLLVLILAGLPLVFSFGFVTLLAILITGVGFEFPPVTAFRSVNSFTLIAVPLFIFSGQLMSSAGISDRLIDFADALVGRIKGGLGPVVILSSMFFGAISGSSVATVATIGTVVLPRMEALGYPRRYTTALVGSCGILGQLIPPSIPLIVYGMAAKVSIAALFIAEIIPGIILATLFGIIHYFSVRKLPLSSPYGEEKPTTGKIARTVAKRAYSGAWALMMPVVILGGIFSGVFTPTEASAVAVFLAVVIGVFFYRKLKAKDIGTTAVTTGRAVGAVLILLCIIAVFARILNLIRVPQQIAELIVGLSENKVIILLLVNLFLFMLGMLMDDVNGTLLAASLLMPLMDRIGVNPLQFGAILAVNLGLGGITPPVAPNMFMAGVVANIPLPQFMGYSVRFMLFGCLPVVLLTTYVPQLTLFLPRLLGFI